MPTPLSLRVLVLAVATAAFGSALYWHETVNIWLGTALAAVVSLALVWRFDRATLRGLFTMTLGQASYGVLSALLLVALCHASYRLLAQSVPLVVAQLGKLTQMLHQPPGPFAALPVLVLVSITEEVIWRGLAVDAFETRFGRWPAALFALLCYMIPQLLSGYWLLVLVALGGGAYWTALRKQTTLAVAALCHSLWGIGIFVVAPLS